MTTHHWTEIRYVSLEELIVDPTYQRPLDPKRMEPGSELDPFNPLAVGTLEVSERADGRLFVLDGNHRTNKGIRDGYGKSPQFPAVVHHGLSVQQEAGMFIQKNAAKIMHPLHKFKARVAAAEPTATALLEMLNSHGWKITGSGSGTGTFYAIGALENIYAGAKIRPEGNQLAACDRTTQILTAAFGHSPHGVKADLVTGVGLLILRFGDQIDPVKLVAEMGKYQGGALGLIGSAKQLKQIRGGAAAQSMAEILIEMHNKGRRTNVLPQWTRPS